MPLSGTPKVNSNVSVSSMSSLNGLLEASCEQVAALTITQYGVHTSSPLTVMLFTAGFVTGTVIGVTL